MANAMKLAHAHHYPQHEREQQVGSSNPAPDNAPLLLHPSRTPLPPKLMEDDKEECVAMEAEANGQDLKRGCKKKPAACGVHGNERQVLAATKLHLFVFSIVEGMYQMRPLMTHWAPLSMRRH
ncbi:hypothetical protein FRC08_010119 [Ceratobasidium sp. 394]|nr:hypothetical protein FRC08_010119 [Ceratobasidium sp. 394]KAG9085804.1 hypothetical protein FS749_004089 [Ceratobasidium sp. UAMH 11750]